MSPNSATSSPSQDTSDRNTPDLSNRANSSSGASTPCNPLLAAGLIPKSLEDILQVPMRKEKKISRRINTKARVITGEEYVEEIIKKEEEIRKIEQEKQRRKRERDEKRAAKEMEKRRKEFEKGKMPMGQQRRKVNLAKCANSDQSFSIAPESNQGPSESFACSARVRCPAKSFGNFCMLCSCMTPYYKSFGGSITGIVLIQ